MQLTTETRPSKSPPIVVRLDGLTKRYGGRTVVDALTVALPAGSVTGFVGPNGAGKTTTLRMLLGLVRPTAGTATIGDGDAARIGAMVEGPAFYPGLGGRRNLRILATLGGIGRRRIDDMLRLVELTEAADRPVRAYSLGMRQRLGIAAALLADSSLVLLDEPTNGLDPAGIREIRSLIRRIADEGATVVVSSHLLTEIEQICDRCIMIREGRILFDGPLAELDARRPTTVLARPEHDAELYQLIVTWSAAGFDVSIEGSAVRVNASDLDTPRLSRAATDAGITLVELRTEQAGLEDTFFELLETAS